MSKLRALSPQSKSVRTLAQVVGYRRKLVQEPVDITNKITTTLKNYFPQAVEWFKEAYYEQLAKGKPRNTIIRALAFKWIRIAFRCWQTRTPYSESKYLEAIKRKASPLLKFLREINV